MVVDTTCGDHFFVGVLGDRNSNEITVTAIHRLLLWFLYLTYIFTDFCSMCSTVAVLIGQVANKIRVSILKKILGGICNKNWKKK
jgi:uncharacterized membrane protein required for colicin V production